MPTPVHPYSDYGVALRTLQTARRWLALLLFAAIIMQFVGFALMYWTRQPYEAMTPEYRPVQTTKYDLLQRQLHTNSTQPGTTTAPVETFFPTTPQQTELNVRKQWDMTYTMLVPLTQIMGLISVSSQAIIAFITLLIVLTGQAPGVAQLTRAVIWAVVLLFMIFPWQYFARDFPVPGVIYGYQEMMQFIGPHVTGQHENLSAFHKLLVLLRFVLWPLIGMLVLLIASERFRAGMMLAIGHPLQSIIQQRPTSTMPTGPAPR